MAGSLGRRRGPGCGGAGRRRRWEAGASDGGGAGRRREDAREGRSLGGWRRREAVGPDAGERRAARMPRRGRYFLLGRWGACRFLPEKKISGQKRHGLRWFASCRRSSGYVSPGRHCSRADRFSRSCVNRSVFGQKLGTSRRSRRTASACRARWGAAGRGGTGAGGQAGATQAARAETGQQGRRKRVRAGKDAGRSKQARTTPGEANGGQERVGPSEGAERAESEREPGKAGRTRRGAGVGGRERGEREWGSARLPAWSTVRPADVRYAAAG